MEIKDLTNFEELTDPEASNVAGGKKKSTKVRGNNKLSCDPGDWGTPPPPPPLPIFLDRKV